MSITGIAKDTCANLWALSGALSWVSGSGRGSLWWTSAQLALFSISAVGGGLKEVLPLCRDPTCSVHAPPLLRNDTRVQDGVVSLWVHPQEADPSCCPFLLGPDPNAAKFQLLYPISLAPPILAFCSHLSNSSLSLSLSLSPALVFSRFRKRKAVSLGWHPTLCLPLSSAASLNLGFC